MFHVKGTLALLVNLINCAQNMSTASTVKFAPILPRLVLIDVMVHAVLESTLAKGSPEWSVRIINHARALKLVRMQTLAMS